MLLLAAATVVQTEPNQVSPLSTVTASLSYAALSPALIVQAAAASNSFMQASSFIPILPAIVIKNS